MYGTGNRVCFLCVFWVCGADVGVIFGTIFDHRQPLRRETKSFVRAFDGKRGIQCKATQQAE